MSGQYYSIVEYIAEHERYKCGYCKSPNTNFSHGIWAYSLTVHDYQRLIDRGWRRSGSYCYKPTMNQTCCPMYTIKCEALQFKISKSQKKILKKMSKFLRNELKKEDITDRNDQDQHDNIDVNNKEIPNYKKHLLNAQRNASEINVSSIDNELNGRLCFGGPDFGEKKSDSKSQLKNSPSINPKPNRNVSDAPSEAMQVTEATTTRTICKKAKLLRIERKQNKLLAQGKSQKEIEAIFRKNKQEQNHAKGLEELFDEACAGTNKLEMKLVRVMSDEFLSTLDVSASLYKKYQMAIHGDPAKECDKKSFFNFLVKSPLQGSRSFVLLNTFVRSHCVGIKNCVISKELSPDDGPPKGYGSFHEQYWLDNELIAVAVIDILPTCISSVYFFYDPAYSHLSLGTFSSLREIYLTRQLNKVARDLKYYYMGFYIHTCPKMRYKGRMKPSMLLCPETYQWYDIETCLRKLENEKYSRLCDDLDAIDQDGVVLTREILVLYKQVAMPYKIYKAKVQPSITRKEKDEVKKYASLVGMKCAQSMLLYRS